MPLGPGQPPAFLEALGRRTDWEHLRIGGALLTVLTDLFSHPNVHYLSGFFGPLERLLRDSGANIGFAPADFRRFTPILEADPPRVMATAGAPPDADGRVQPVAARRGQRRPDPPAGGGPRPAAGRRGERPRSRAPSAWATTCHALAVDEIDVLIESDKAPVVIDDPPPTDVDRAIAEHVRAFVPDGATLQTGIGAVPSVVASLLAEGDGGGYGIHSEMFTTGLMRLHQAGKVTNHKGTYDGVSVATFAAGTRELYDWLDENHDVAFLPVDLVNSPEVIARNRAMVTINAAMAVDIQGQVVADTIGAVQYSGIGGHEDFVSGPALDLEDRSLLCLPSTVTVGDELRSRIVPWFEAGAVITTPAPPGRRDRHRVRRRRAPGPDRPPARRGAGRHRPPRLPRGPARGRRARQPRPLAVPHVADWARSSRRTPSSSCSRRCATTGASASSGASSWWRACGRSTGAWRRAGRCEPRCRRRAPSRRAWAGGGARGQVDADVIEVRAGPLRAPRRTRGAARAPARGAIPPPTSRASPGRPTAWWCVLDRPSSPATSARSSAPPTPSAPRAVLTTGHGAHLYDPRTVRASVGSLFALPVVPVASNQELVDWVAALASRGGPHRVRHRRGTATWSSDRAPRCDGPPSCSSAPSARGLARALRDLADVTLAHPDGRLRQLAERRRRPRHRPACPRR